MEEYSNNELNADQFNEVKYLCIVNTIAIEALMDVLSETNIVDKQKIMSEITTKINAYNKNAQTEMKNKITYTYFGNMGKA